MLNFLYNSGLAIGGFVGVVGLCFGWMQKNKKTTWGSIVTALIAIVSLAFLTSSLIVVTQFVRTPYFYNKTLVEAEDLAFKNSIRVGLPEGIMRTRELDDVRVHNQNIDPDELVVKHKTTVIVELDSYQAESQSSDLQNMTTVPNVVGKKYSEATEILNEKGLHWNPTTVNGAAVVIEESFVTAQSIDPGENVSIGTRIDLVLTPSLHDDPVPIVFDNKIIVPNVVGMGVDEARKTLLDSGFGIVSYSGAIFEDIDGYVIQQSIPANTEVYKGMSIELHVISVKPGTQVTVPNVVGLEQHEAAEMLLRSGLQFQVWWTDDDVENNVYYVVEQSIPYSNSVPAGTVVKLHISSSNP